MATLKDDEKLFIVHALACFDTPSQVAAQLKEEYGIEITRMQAASYDPTTIIGKRCAKKWAEIFHEVRKAFLADTSGIAIANKAYRLRVLDRMAKQAESKGNKVLTAQLIEQAAKEVGEFHVNRNREPPKIPGADGPAIPKTEYVLKPDENAPANPIL